MIPPIAHEVGILEVRSGRVKHVSLPEKLVYGVPVWSPVGDALAFGAGSVEGSRTGGFRVSCDVHVAEERSGLAFSLASPGGEGLGGCGPEAGRFLWCSGDAGRGGRAGSLAWR